MLPLLEAGNKKIIVNTFDFPLVMQLISFSDRVLPARLLTMMDGILG